MVEKEILEEPMIFQGAGSCPYCGGELIVLDSELTFVSIDKDGNPLDSQTSVKCMGKCVDCGEKVNMMRWEGKYIIRMGSSDTLYKQFIRREQIKSRLKELESMRNNNPLGIVSNITPLSS